MDIQFVIDRLRTDLPTIFTRQYVCKQLGGYLSPAGLANLDSSGKGPGGLRSGRVFLYEKEAFLVWFEKRLTDSSLSAE